MAVKYEALRLLLAGTALILTAMLTTPKMTSQETSKHAVTAEVASTPASSHKHMKKLKSHFWPLISYYDSK